MLQNHLLEMPGVILGVPEPNVPTGTYLSSFNFGRQVIDLSIANGGIDMELITEAELIVWELELMNVLYEAETGRSGRAAAFSIVVNDLDNGEVFTMEPDLSAFDLTVHEIEQQISVLEVELVELFGG